MIYPKKDPACSLSQINLALHLSAWTKHSKFTWLKTSWQLIELTAPPTKSVWKWAHTATKLTFYLCLFLTIYPDFLFSSSRWDCSFGRSNCGNVSASSCSQLWWANTVSVWSIWERWFVSHVLWRPHLHEHGNRFNQWVSYASVKNKLLH